MAEAFAACECMWLLLQVVIPLVWMEGHAVVLRFLSVTVPVGTQDPTVRTEVAKHSKPETCTHGSCWTHELNSCMCGSLLQGAIPPVIMAEHALFQLPRFTATAPMALQDLTARLEVHIATYIHTLCNTWSMKQSSIIRHCVCLTSAACSPACQNGGTCHGSGIPFCDCPSGYTGSHCQERGGLTLITRNMYA